MPITCSIQITIETWQAWGEENQPIVVTTKKQIRERFKHEFGLFFDKPNPSHENSDDGNTARRFFTNAILLELI